LKPLAEGVEEGRGRRGGPGQEANPGRSSSLLRFGTERRQNEAENDREPD
jgi:hypothetical protein